MFVFLIWKFTPPRKKENFAAVLKFRNILQEWGKGEEEEVEEAEADWRKRGGKKLEGARKGERRAGENSKRILPED